MADPRADSPQVAKRRLYLMLVLTFSTGIIDAVGYLGLDRVFTGNMTGNVVILGMGLAGADGLPVLGPAVALLGFMSGAAIGGRAVRGLPPGWHARHVIILLAVGTTLLIAASLAWWVPDLPKPLALTITTALGLAMGMQAAAARHVAVREVTTVVVTSTMTGLAADSVLGRSVAQPWRRRLAAIVLIGLGAASGGLLLQLHLGVGLLVSAAISLAVAFAGKRWA